MHRLKRTPRHKRLIDEDAKNHSKKLIPPEEYWEFENPDAGAFSTPQRIYISSRKGTPTTAFIPAKDEVIEQGYNTHRSRVSLKSLSSLSRQSTPRHYLSAPRRQRHQNLDDENEDFDDVMSNISGIPGEIRRKPLRFGIVTPSISQILLDFCARTSSHGIPHIGASASIFGKLFWTVVFIICFLAFTFQTYWTIYRFTRYDKIIEMELKFEPAPFPSVTVCNINPYKYSLAKNYQEMKKIFDAHEYKLQQKDHETQNRRRRRRKRSHSLEPLYAKCRCNRKDMECVPVRDPAEPQTDACFCYFDTNTRSLWPCYQIDTWTSANCTDCTLSGTCLYPRELLSKKPKGSDTFLIAINTRSGLSGETVEQEDRTPCICQNISYSCLIDPLEPIDVWDPHAYQTYEPPVEIISREELDEMGLNENVTDEGTVTTKANENLVFAAGSLAPEIRENISYSKNDLILQCTFNGVQCQLDKDFKFHLDPVFGSCYTFNHNFTAAKTYSRAGPTYVLDQAENPSMSRLSNTAVTVADTMERGPFTLLSRRLRLLLNVNQSDYLPITEMAGVRITVHDQTQQPFPDTFGYSAPVGFFSSFGLRSNELERLGPPFGECRTEKREEERYIYEEQYSTEGCYRSCFQNFIINNCHCGDPRFPIPEDIVSCSNKTARHCVRNVTGNVGDFDFYGEECDCIQPCREFTFQVTFSAAMWPSSNFKIGQCPFLNTSQSCFEYYAKHTSYVEVYYEQLNYELRKEKEAYGMESLLADFGGNIGLWIGFSAITMVEWLLLFIEMITYALHEAPYSKVQEHANRIRQKKLLKAVVGDVANKPISYSEDTPKYIDEEADLTLTPL